ncbi:hypothetical protein AB4Y32_38505 [Paraburkholderia phymatum]|uniref:Uncharacterized protein n=1 Tax=Paraburkholderia phymatum TaxID=148447 RepID=A0ACC6UD06_9BURK
MSNGRTRSEAATQTARRAGTVDMKLEVIAIPVSDVVSEIFHDVGGVFHRAGVEGRLSGPHPERRTTVHSLHSAIQMEMAGSFRR